MAAAETTSAVFMGRPGRRSEPHATTSTADARRKFADAVSSSLEPTMRRVQLIGHARGASGHLRVSIDDFGHIWPLRRALWRARQRKFATRARGAIEELVKVARLGLLSPPRVS